MDCVLKEVCQSILNLTKRGFDKSNKYVPQNLLDSFTKFGIYALVAGLNQNLKRHIDCEWAQPMKYFLITCDAVKLF